MDHFQDLGDTLHAEKISLPLLAERFKSLRYVYSRATSTRHWHAFEHAFCGSPDPICFAVKRNSHQGALNVPARLASAFDIVSVGELERVLALTDLLQLFGVPIEYLHLGGAR